MTESYKFKASRALHVLVAISSLVFSAYAHAILLKIDASTSQVTYTSGSGFPVCITDPSGVTTCPEPPVIRTAALSGLFELNVDRDLLRLTTIGFSAGALSTEFPLTGAIGLITEGRFEVRDDPCFLVPTGCSGFVLSTGDWGQDGTWDGYSLSWTGYSSELFGDSFNFTITAEALQVSEPGTLALMVLALFGARRQRRTTPSR